MRLSTMCLSRSSQQRKWAKDLALGCLRCSGLLSNWAEGCVSKHGRARVTTVNVYLPRANEDLVPTTDRPTESRPDPETGDFRRAIVLLVDDDAEVRAATAEMLRYVGHDVLEAGSGREALDSLDPRRDRIDRMIVAYVMPGMNGVEFARLARLKRPPLPILSITGFADTAVLAAEANSHHILRKPFYTADLVAKIEGALRIATG